MGDNQAIKTASEGFKFLRGQAENGGPPFFRTDKSLWSYLDFMHNLSEEILHAREAGKKVVWHSLLVPGEIIASFDNVIPLCLELFTLIGGYFTEGGVEKFTGISAGYGIPQEVCSAHRIMDGMVIGREVPSPDVIVGSTNPCDSIMKSWEIIQNATQVPKFQYDIPYHFNEDSFAYTVAENQRLAKFLEEQLGQKLDQERLRKNLELSQKVDSLYMEVNDLRRNIPSPMHGADQLNNVVMNFIGCSKPIAITYFETIKSEMNARIQQGKGVVDHERYRIGWLGGVPLFARDLVNWMEQEYSAVLVLEQNGFWLKDDDMDMSKPMEYVARKMFTRCIRVTNSGPLELTLPMVANKVRDFQCDGVIFFASIGCPQTCGGLRVRRDSLQEEVGIPLMTISGDVCDPTVVSIDEMKNKMEEFFEILEEKPVASGKE
jgi:benzoyl-CoA reductase/2-hydroxyglutaryl-CoA dehydratase subunit BcrC/BadD/HgdB